MLVTKERLVPVAKRRQLTNVKQGTVNVFVHVQKKRVVNTTQFGEGCRHQSPLPNVFYLVTLGVADVLPDPPAVHVGKHSAKYSVGSYVSLQWKSLTTILKRWLHRGPARIGFPRINNDPRSGFPKRESKVPWTWTQRDTWSTSLLSTCSESKA